MLERLPRSAALLRPPLSSPKPEQRPGTLERIVRRPVLDECLLEGREGRVEVAPCRSKKRPGSRGDRECPGSVERTSPGLPTARGSGPRDPRGRGEQRVEQIGHVPEQRGLPDAELAKDAVGPGEVGERR